MDNDIIWRRVLDDPDSSYNTGRSAWQDIYDWILPLAHGIVLDVGCGLGHLAKTLMLSPKVLGVTGVDISIVAVEEARQRYPHPRVTFDVEDIESTERLQSGLYDCVCFTQVLEHIENDVELIGRIPHGKSVFISVPKEEAHYHESHVNFFGSIDALRYRYQSLIDIQYIGEAGPLRFLCLYGKRNANEFKHNNQNPKTMVYKNLSEMPLNKNIYLHCVYANRDGEVSLNLSSLARHTYLKSNQLQINTAAFNAAYAKANWFETIFPDIEIVRYMRDKIPSHHRGLVSILPEGNMAFDVLIADMKRALKEYLWSNWDGDATHLCWHSAGYDSRIISGILTELREENGDDWIGNIHFRCHQPEEKEFLEIMKLQGWRADQYSVWEKPSQDHYNVGRTSQVLNGFNPLTHQMDFTSDIVPDYAKKDTVLITGSNGGEFFCYPAIGMKPVKNVEYCENPNVNRWMNYFAEEGEWLSMLAYEYKDVMAPFLSYEYLKLASLVQGKYVKPINQTLDTVRKAILETMSVNTLSVGYGFHKYSWGISHQTITSMESWYANSKFYKDYGIKVDFDSISDNISGHDGKLWAFSLMYEKVFAPI